MPITETARKNHETLFPNHESALARTDPELIEVFDFFGFDEVLRHGDIDQTRLMAILASLIAQQAPSEYRVMLAAAFNVGVTPIEAKEILYHSIPYVGMAKAFDFLHATKEVLTSPCSAAVRRGPGAGAGRARHLRKRSRRRSWSACPRCRSRPSSIHRDAPDIFESRHRPARRIASSPRPRL